VTIFGRVRMPSLGGATEWLNSEPLSPAELQGRVPLRGVGAPDPGRLGVERELVSVEGVGVEAEADWDRLGTPETYLGAWRAERRADGPADRLQLNHWTVAGDWTVVDEKVVVDQAGASIAFRFHARDVHLVLAPGPAREPIPFRVLVDGEAPGPSHGVDVDEGGNGVLQEGRLYQLVRARRGPRADAGDHFPGARRRGVRVHVWVAEMDGWAIVAVASSEPEAELLCSVLRGSGIDCLPRLTNSGAGAGDGLGTVGAHDILVSPQDAQDAREILHARR
jgi:hypothetical protein